MSTETLKPPCALCGQAVEIQGFELNTPTAKLPFCCAGCLSIYQLLNDDQPTDQPPPTKKEVS